jgi:transposase InsO family protein
LGNVRSLTRRLAVGGTEDGDLGAAAGRRPDPPFRSGVQYASAEYRKMMQSAGFRASMSRRADCYDNAPMESFFHTLKTELVHHQHYATREQARRDIFAYIEASTTAHQNTHLSMLLKRRDFADWDAIPWGILGSVALVRR